MVVNTPAGGPPRMRRTSATSSLELGYSHTAQNSAVSSETASFPGAIYDRCKKGGKYAGKLMSFLLLLEKKIIYNLRWKNIMKSKLKGLKEK